MCVLCVEKVEDKWQVVGKNQAIFQVSNKFETDYPYLCSPKMNRGQTNYLLTARP
jgi:hypothetical protein